MQMYEIVTGERKVRRVTADKVELNPAGNTVRFYANGNPVGSFVGFTDYYPVEADAPAPTES